MYRLPNYFCTHCLCYFSWRDIESESNVIKNLLILIQLYKETKNLWSYLTLVLKGMYSNFQKGFVVVGWNLFYQNIQFIKLGYNKTFTLLNYTFSIFIYCNEGFLTKHLCILVPAPLWYLNCINFLQCCRKCICLVSL